MAGDDHQVGLVLREVPTDLAAVQGRLRHHAAALLEASASQKPPGSEESVQWSLRKKIPKYLGGNFCEKVSFSSLNH